jgi:hypothetical protein
MMITIKVESERQNIQLELSCVSCQRQRHEFKLTSLDDILRRSSGLSRDRVVRTPHQASSNGPSGIVGTGSLRPCA